MQLDDPGAIAPAYGSAVLAETTIVYRYGHNELEDPKATLPLTYGRIIAHPPVLQLYSEKLQEAGLVSQAEVNAWQVQVS